MRNDPYPKTVAEVIDPKMKFKPAALAALRAFRAARPWSGSLDERQQKFKTLHKALCEAYGLPRLSEMHAWLSECHRHAAKSRDTGALDLVQKRLLFLIRVERRLEGHLSRTREMRVRSSAYVQRGQM